MGAGAPGLGSAPGCIFGIGQICLNPWSFKHPLCGSQWLDLGSWAVYSQTSAFGGAGHVAMRPVFRWALQALGV